MTNGFVVPGLDSQDAYDLLSDRFPTEGGINAQVVVEAPNGSLLSDSPQRNALEKLGAALSSIDGVEVVVPQNQGCCGALSWHVGDLNRARKFARSNVAAFPQDVDAVVTNAAGCGSGMHEYPQILKGTVDEAAAKEFADNVCDVSVYLTRLGELEPLPDRGRTLRVAYHDACHLSNAQGVRSQPRSLLQAIPGVELCEIADAHLCCGSAGTYNIDQPEVANALGSEKAENIIRTNADLVASGNIGCMTQLKTHLAKCNSSMSVSHTMQVLRDAYCENDG